MKSLLHFGLVLVLVLVWHLNVLAKQNKLNLCQVKTSFIVSFMPAYFDENAPSDKHQGTEICSETDRHQHTSVINE